MNIFRTETTEDIMTKPHMADTVQADHITHSKTIGEKDTTK